MGNKNPKFAEESNKNAEIEKELAASKQASSKEVKLLLLGAGESGKSTFVKQMKQIYLGGFTKEELLSWKEMVQDNLVTAMAALVDACGKLGIPFDEKNQATAAAFAEGNYGAMPGAYSRNAAIPSMLEQLWTDSGIQAALGRAAEFQLIDSTGYLFENISRIHSPNYVPTFEDVIRVRSRTTGIVETQFSAGGLNFRMFDVGGQRNERKKWIHCFDNVTAVLFLVGTSEYDQVLFEDHSMNRVQESLELFSNIVSLQYFDKASFILFMNKQDLFEAKLKKVPLTVTFPEYTGTTIAAAKKFMLNEYTKRAPVGKTIYSHWTSATETDNVAIVFDAARNTIVTSNLQNLGFL
jgi:GTPase SAR1 family protein